MNTKVPGQVMCPWLQSALRSRQMDKEQADHLSFGGQGLFGENTNADRVMNAKHKAIKCMVLTEESWRGLEPFGLWGYTHSLGLGCILQTEDRQGLLLSKLLLP